MQNWREVQIRNKDQLRKASVDTIEELDAIQTDTGYPAPTTNN